MAGNIPSLQTLEGRSQDWRFVSRGGHGPLAANIVLVMVEEGADLPYRSPIPRAHLAQVIENLDQAALIGLDILLDQPSFDQEGDERLHQALGCAGNVVAVSYIDVSAGEERLPNPHFLEVLLDYGYATFATGLDVEVVRRGTLGWRMAEGLALSLAGCLYAHFEGLDTDAVRAGDTILPWGDLLINFSGPPSAVYRARGGLAGGFPTCPSHLVAAGVYPPAFFKDKVVLIGSGLMDAPDQFRTPFFARAYENTKSYGVEVHAHFLRTLLEEDILREWGEGWLLLAVGIMALAAVALVLFSDVLRSVLGALLLLVGWWGAGFGLFLWSGVMVPLVVPSLALLASLGGAVAYNALTEGREKRQVRRLFERYLAPDVVRQLLEDPSYWEMGGKTMDITVMFADLEGFTPISERLGPQKLVGLINEFLSEMSGIIWMEGGTIDKYEGDLIMAFFGAPLPQLDSASRGCRAALQMQARMAQLRQKWKDQGLPELRVRIGLHTGLAVVGNMGSEFHSNYTAMGDTVNLASRLEAGNKEFGTYVLVSEATRQQAGADEFEFRGLGQIVVKGKSTPTTVYELVSAAGGEESAGGSAEDGA